MTTEESPSTPRTFSNAPTSTALLNKQVNEVKENAVVLTDNVTKVTEEVPFGMAVWCTGIKLNPLCEKIMNALPEGSQEVRSVQTF